MRKIKRTPATKPAFLTKEVPDDARKKIPVYITTEDKYTKAWKRKIAKSKNANFIWYDLRDKLLELLTQMTQHHCSFCDKLFGADNRVEIEHFKPKIQFPDLAYNWTNLYAICSKCNNEKGKTHSDKLLQPDNSDYTFKKYFTPNYLTGKLDIIDNENNALYMNIKTTIGIYKLNRKTLCTARKRELGKYNEVQSSKTEVKELIQLVSKENFDLSKFPMLNKQNKATIDINDYSYRDFIENV